MQLVCNLSGNGVCKVEDGMKDNKAEKKVISSFNDSISAPIHPTLRYTSDLILE